MDSKSLSHTRWKCQYHIVFIPKYRKKVLYGRLMQDVREIISALCKYKNIEIVSGAVCKDHIHLCVCIPPKMSISSFMGYLKGKSTLMIYDRHPEMQSKWDKAFWARCCDNRQCDRSGDKEIHRRAVRRVEERRYTKPLVSGSR